MGAVGTGRSSSESEAMQQEGDCYIYIPAFEGPAAARLTESGVSIWALVLYYRAVDQDADRVARDYEISREAVDAGLAYYARHRAAIDARIDDHLAAVA